jgi:lysosomal Pro-X carboxypeptidase
LTYCRFHFGHIGFNSSLFRPEWAIDNYGAEFPTATNLIFSNGWLDPWSGGGWRLKPTQEGSLISLIIEDGAHHYDLRGQHPNDTEAVKEVRLLEKYFFNESTHKSNLILLQRQ